MTTNFNKVCKDSFEFCSEFAMIAGTIAPFAFMIIICAGNTAIFMPALYFCGFTAVVLALSIMGMLIVGLTMGFNYAWNRRQAIMDFINGVLRATAKTILISSISITAIIALYAFTAHSMGIDDVTIADSLLGDKQATVEIINCGIEELGGSILELAFE